MHHRVASSNWQIAYTLRRHWMNEMQQLSATFRFIFTSSILVLPIQLLHRIRVNHHQYQLPFLTTTGPATNETRRRRSHSPRSMLENTATVLGLYASQKWNQQLLLTRNNKPSFFEQKKKNGRSCIKSFRQTVTAYFFARELRQPWPQISKQK